MEGTKKLGQLIKGIRFAMMTTVAADGSLHSRPMATQESEFDGTLWFFTDDSSPKVAELYHHREVAVTYVDPHGHRYVSVNGRGQVVRDREKAQALWQPMLRAWFPDGLDDPHLALIRVDVERAEYWDAPSAPKRLLGMAKAVVTGKRYAGGENVKLDLKNTG